MRLYKEFVQGDGFSAMWVPVRVPVGLSLFPNEIAPAPPDREIHRHFKNILFLRSKERGGHFAAFEEPESLARDLLDFTRLLGWAPPRE